MGICIDAEGADPTVSQDVDTGAADGSVTTSRDGAILRVTLDRPSARNSLSQSMIETFVGALTDAATDDALRAIHIRGAGDHFCAGADWVATNSGGERPRTGDLVRRVPQAAHRVIELIQSIQLPVVCSIRGWAVGLGCNLALAADFTVAATDALFWEPFVTRGFSPDSGSTWLLPRLVGLARAKQMLLLGDKVNATDAAQWGLIHRTVSPAELPEATEELLARLSTGPTVAIGLAKQALHYGQHATLNQSMTQELFNLELSCRTGDFKEGLAAFRQRRAPEFRGR
jgi:2-(1,2-epoxy-1,2-dihydrophenyl)acetyl-CoA isomerase